MGEALRAKQDFWSGLTLAALMLLAFALVGRSACQVASGPKPPGPGMSAPAIEGAAPDGRPLSLGGLRGQVVLVDFWATWCPPCVAAMPGLERLQREYGPRGFQVFGVNQEKGEEALVLRFIAEHRLSFPVLMDDGRHAQGWGVYSFPTSFLLGADGKIRESYRGPASEGRLRRDVEAALLAASSTTAGAPR